MCCNSAAPQCCIPVFEGLLPEACEDAAQKLLFVFAEWHGLAKLWVHTGTLLTIMKVLRTDLGVLLLCRH